MNLLHCNTPAGQYAKLPTFELLEELKDEVDGRVILSPTKFISLMKLDLNVFAQHARVHRNTVARAPASLSVQNFLRVNVRVLRAAYDVSGRDLGRAIFWYQNEPLAPFDYKTAETLVSDGRVDDVVRYVESLEAGFVG